MFQEKYVVERFEHGVWVPKCRTNFEDPNFYTIAKSELTRIMKNGVDVTEQFGGVCIPAKTGRPVITESSLNISEGVSKALMKPAAYKALSDSEKSAMQKKATELKDQKLKRTEIMAELGITESTYDAIRKDIADKETAGVTTQSAVTPSVSVKPETAAPVRRVGLLGRR